MNKYDLLLHVDKADGSINIAFANACNYAKALPKEAFSMVLVVNSKAVTHLVAGNTDMDKEKFEQARAAGLAIKPCLNALNASGLSPEQLVPGCEVVPAGLVEIVDLQRAGYAYVKP